MTERGTVSTASYENGHIPYHLHVYCRRWQAVWRSRPCGHPCGERCCWISICRGRSGGETLQQSCTNAQGTSNNYYGALPSIPLKKGRNDIYELR